MFIYLSKRNAEVLESFFDEFVGENSEALEELCDVMNEIRIQVQENRNSGQKDEKLNEYFTKEILNMGKKLGFKGFKFVESEKEDTTLKFPKKYRTNQK